MILLKEAFDGTLLDINGRIVGSYFHADRIDLSGVCPGTYFLRRTNAPALRVVVE